MKISPVVRTLIICLVAILIIVVFFVLTGRKETKSSISESSASDSSVTKSKAGSAATTALGASGDRPLPNVVPMPASVAEAKPRSGAVDVRSTGEVFAQPRSTAARGQSFTIKRIPCRVMQDCIPPDFPVRLSNAVPFDATVNYAGEIKLGGAVHWLWVKSGESSRPCNEQELTKASYSYGCNVKKGELLFITFPFQSIEAPL